MLTLRPLPRSAPVHPDPLLGLYYSGLLRHWGTPARALARAIDRLLTGFGGPGERILHGIEAREWDWVEGRCDPAHFVTMRARRGIHRLLNPGALPLRNSVLKDKRRFAAFLAAHKLAGPRDCADAEALPRWLDTQNAIMVKPNFSSKGRGVIRFSRSGPGWSRDDGSRFESDALIAELGTALAQGCILQTALTTLPALEPVSPGALPTLRIVTILDDSGAPHTAARILRFGGGDAPVDNFSRGGLAATLDPGGTLGTVMRGSPGGLKAAASHPHTGAPFPKRMPAGLLAAAEKLTASVHRAMGDGLAVIAWDVGLSDEGPMLIEGNWNPGTNVMQLLDGRGLSQQPGGQLYIAALKRVPESRWMAALPIQRDR